MNLTSQRRNLVRTATRPGGALRSACPILLVTGVFLALGVAPAGLGADFNSLPAAQRTEVYRRTDQQFFARHPELQGRSLGPNADPALRREYMALRGEVAAQMGSPAKSGSSPSAGTGGSAGPNQWNGEAFPLDGASSRTGGGATPATTRDGGSASAGSLDARAMSMTQEARRLADEYSTASPQRMEQIRGRLQQMYQEALVLQKDYLALGAGAAGGPNAGSPASGVAGGPSGSGGGMAAGTVGATGQLTPASSLAVSPRDFFQQLASERAQKAAVRDRQAEIMDAGARDQQGYLDEGRTAYNLAAGRAGLDVFNGVSRTAMAAAAPTPLYQSYEALNAGASLAKDSGSSLFDPDFNLNNPFDGRPRSDASLTPASVAQGVRIAKDASSVYRNSEQVVNGLPPVFVPGEEPNIFNNFGHAPEIDPGPSRLSQNLRNVGRGIEVLDGAANSVKLGQNLSDGQYFEATKNAADLGGNFASVAGNQAGGRVASGAKGVLATAEGVKNMGSAWDEKDRFSQNTQATLDQFSAVAEQRRRQAARERELNQWILQLPAQTPAIAPNVVPPAGGPNRDYFKTE